ncbi:MAG: hypothetical protein MJA29_07265 [Candidatus Omnitrophica bacterium]|nr:hypothetical protein [Candidatus Omnitrophota bacterium]
MKKCALRFIVHSPASTADEVKCALAEFAEAVEVRVLTHPQDPGAREFDVSLLTEDPTLVFDSCAGLGRIKSVKVIEDREHS